MPRKVQAIPPLATLEKQGFQIFPEDHETAVENAGDALIRAVSRVLDRSSKKSLIDWTEEHYKLPEGGARRGSYKFSNVPYLRGVAERLDSDKPEHRMIVLKKGTQIGATELGIAWILWSIDNKPVNMLLYQETEKKVEELAKTRLRPALSREPFDYMARPGSSTGEFSMTNIIFPGGQLYLRGAGSASAFSSTTAGKILGDEYARYKANIGGEGDAASLWLGRIASFGTKGKIYIPSTPVDDLEREGSFESLYQAGDKLCYFCKCPHCDNWDFFKKANFKYKAETSGLVTDAWFECEKCKGKIEEDKHKPFMIDSGDWQPTQQRSNAFVTSMYLPSWNAAPGSVSWMEIAQQYESANRGKTSMASVHQTYFAMGWSDLVDAVDPDEARRSHTVDIKYDDNGRPLAPRDTVFCTLSADLQKKFIKWELKAWTANMRSYSLDAQRIEGNFKDKNVQNALKEVIAREVYDEEGENLGAVPCCMIDTSYADSQTEAYTFCDSYDKPKFSKSRRWRRPPQMVLPFRGRADLEPKSLLESYTTYKQKRGNKYSREFRLWQCGSNLAKQMLFGSLSKSDEHNHMPETALFSSKYGDGEWSELAAEQPIAEKRGNRDVTVFHRKPNTDNEMIDLHVMNRCAAEVLVNSDNSTMAELAERRGLVLSEDGFYYEPRNTPTDDTDTESTDESNLSVRQLMKKKLEEKKNLR